MTAHSLKTVRLSYYYYTNADFVIDLCKTYAKCGSPGDIPPLLNKLFNALQSIPPTSVESERAFSITGQFATKLRTKLADNTLNSIVFLKASYKKESKS
jgi:hypothetical protein